MIHTRFMRTIAAGLVALPLAVSASSESKGELPSFDEIDKDGDGEISFEQAAEAGAPKELAKDQDMSGDGKLSETEWNFLVTTLKHQRAEDG